MLSQPGAGDQRAKGLHHALGVREGKDVVSYCGSGVTACHNLLALEVASLAGGRLYPGSWTDWCVRPDAPVATSKES